MLQCSCPSHEPLIFHFTSHGDILKRIECAYRAVQAHEGQVEIEKDGIRETLKVRYGPL